MKDNGLTILAGMSLVAGALIGGIIIVSGVLAAMPGADTLMALALLALVPATLLLVVFLIALGKSTG